MASVRAADVLLRLSPAMLERYQSLVVAGPGRGRVPPVPYVFSRADAATCATLVYGQRLPAGRAVGAGIRQALAGTPRLEWLDLDGDSIRERAGVLLEPGRLNAFLRSEEFDHAAWQKTLCTISANASTAPNGAGSADHLVESVDGAPADHHVHQAPPTLTDNTLQSVSVFARAIGRTWLLLQARTKSSSFPRASFNLSTGTIGTVSGDASAVAFIDKPFVTVSGTVYYRCMLVYSSNAGGGTPAVWFFPCSADNTTLYQGDGRVSLALWGAQFETDQARPTSYIKTVGATVARAADSLMVPTFHGPQPLTVYVEWIERMARTGVDGRVFAFSGEAAPYFALQVTGTNYRTIHDGGTGLVTSGTLAAATYGQRVRAAARLYADGSTEFERAIEAGATSTSSRSSTTALGTYWSGRELWLGRGNGAPPEPFVLLDCRVLRGTFTLAECEAFS